MEEEEFETVEPAEAATDTVAEPEPLEEEFETVGAFPASAGAPMFFAAPAPSTLEDVARLGVSGATLGTQPELTGAAAAVPEFLGGKLMEAKKTYERVMAEQRAKREEARARQPILGGAAEMVGGVLTPLPLPRGANFLSRLGTGAAIGTGTAAVQGAAEAGPDNRLAGAIQGGKYGLGAGLAVPVVGQVLRQASRLLPGTPGSVVNAPVAQAASAVTGGKVDAPFYERMLSDPDARRRAFAARRQYTDLEGATEAFDDFATTTDQRVLQEVGNLRRAGATELTQQGAMAQPRAAVAQTIDRAIVRAEPFPDRFGADFMRAVRNAREAVQGVIPGVQHPPRGEDFVYGLQTARQDMDAIINGNPKFQLPPGNRFEQQFAREIRDEIDAVLKTSPAWVRHDELYAAWAPIKKVIDEKVTGGRYMPQGDPSYRKFEQFMNSSGGPGEMAQKRVYMENMDRFMQREFANDPVLQEWNAFMRMFDDLSMAKGLANLGAGSGLTTGRFGSLMTALGGLASGTTAGTGAAGLAIAASPVIHPGAFLAALNGASTAQEFLGRILPSLGPQIRPRVIIMANQAMRQKPDMSSQEMAEYLQNTLLGGE